MAMTTDSMTTPKPNRRQRRDFAKLPAAVRWVIEKLDLDQNRRYDLGAVRVSAKGAFDKLEDQQGTGVTVFADNDDFQALAGKKDVRERGWVPVKYSDVGGTKETVFAWIGVVGNTIFVAAADSAAEANIPPPPDNIYGVGENAYVNLFTACARAGNVKNILLPFLSRIWREDLWAEMLMKTINRHLPGCTVWNGKKKLATHGSEKLLTNVEGRQASAYVETMKEQIFEKGVGHISIAGGGQWDRRESELPLGLQRERTVQPDGTVTKALRVVESEWRPVVVEALRKRAAGKSYEAIGEFFAEKGVPMRGTKARGRTFAEYSTKSARTAAVKAILSPDNLDYYRTGEINEVRTVGLPGEEVRGIAVEHDPDTGRGVKHLRIRLPHRKFLTDAEWAAFDRVEADEEKDRNNGAAARDLAPDDRVSPFQGVASYVDDEDGLEHVLVPDSATAYRWRTREPEDRGWGNGEGTITATLRRTLFNAGFGRAFLESLRDIEDQLAPATTPGKGGPDDPLTALEDDIARIENEIDARERASARADKELEEAEGDEDDDEIDHWRKKGKQARSELRRLRGELAAAEQRLAAAATEVVEVVETKAADIAEAVLVASLLLDGDRMVEPIVYEALRDYGVLATLRLARTGPQMVQATATAQVPLLDGTKHEVVVTWETPDSHETTGDGALVPAMVRLWATGHNDDEIASHFPGHDADRVRRRLRKALQRGGIASKALRTAALKCPITATRAVIAAVVLNDEELAAPYSAPFHRHVEAAYFGDPSRRTSIWADTATLREVRRVLDVLALDPDGHGANADLLARNANAPQSLVRDFARDGLLEKVGPLALRAKRCTHARCGGLLTIYLPAPETGSGLICARCWRPDGVIAALPGDYAERWVRADDGDYVVDVRQAVTPAKAERDRLLTTTEAAEQLGISATGVRQLDTDGELVPTSRHGINSGRLYSLAVLDAVPEETLARWRERFGCKDDDGLLGTADVAALLNCSTGLVRDMRRAGVLVPVATTSGGHSRYRRADVDAIDRADIRAYDLAEIGAAAETVGLPTATLRSLADDGLVPCAWTILGHRRFDIDAISTALEDLDLLSSPDNPIVSIGELAEHPEVQLSTGQVRRLTDEGIIRAAGRLGGKRRYRLQDALDDLTTAREAGTAAPPAHVLLRR